MGLVASTIIDPFFSNRATGAEEPARQLPAAATAAVDEGSPETAEDPRREPLPRAKRRRVAPPRARKKTPRGYNRLVPLSNRSKLAAVKYIMPSATCPPLELELARGDEGGDEGRSTMLRARGLDTALRLECPPPLAAGDPPIVFTGRSVAAITRALRVLLAEKRAPETNSYAVRRFKFALDPADTASISDQTGKARAARTNYDIDDDLWTRLEPALSAFLCRARSAQDTQMRNILQEIHTNRYYVYHSDTDGAAFDPKTGEIIEEKNRLGALLMKIAEENTLVK